MARITPIRIRNKDRLTLQSLNTRARRKQNRLLNLYNVSPTFNVRPIESFKTRAEFNKYIRDVELYVHRSTNRYVKINNNLSVPRTEYQQLQRAIKNINRRNKQITNKIDSLPFLSRGVPQDITVGQRRLMAPSYRVQFKQISLDNSKIRDVAHFREIYNRRLNQSRGYTTGSTDIQYRQNYIKALRDNFGGMANELIEFILSIPLSTFILISAYGLADFTDIRYPYDIGEAQEMIANIRLGFESAYNYVNNIE